MGKVLGVIAFFAFVFGFPLLMGGAINLGGTILLSVIGLCVAAGIIQGSQKAEIHKAQLKEARRINQEP